MITTDDFWKHITSAKQVVYFLHITHPDGREVIKVGETAEFARRFRTHSKCNLGATFHIEPLCVVRGSKKDEGCILRYFKDHLVPGEVETFFPVPDLVDYIRWLRDQFYVWVPNCELIRNLDSIEVVEASIWLPTDSSKRKPALPRGLFKELDGPLGLAPRTVTPDDFYTDEKIIKCARQVFGGVIDLDPASHAVANSVVKAVRFFTVGDNGLERNWYGNVWVNPPFSEWKSWSAKIASEWKSGRITDMCALCATRTLTAQYLAPLHDNCAALCILHGRIPFWGQLAGSPDEGHAIFYFGTHAERFEAGFRDIGTIYSPSRTPSENEP